MSWISLMRNTADIYRIVETAPDRTKTRTKIGAAIQCAIQPAATTRSITQGRVTSDTTDIGFFATDPGIKVDDELDDGTSIYKCIGKAKPAAGFPGVPFFVELKARA